LKSFQPSEKNNNLHLTLKETDIGSCNLISRSRKIQQICHLERWWYKKDNWEDFQKAVYVNSCLMLSLCGKFVFSGNGVRLVFWNIY